MVIVISAAPALYLSLWSESRCKCPAVEEGYLTEWGPAKASIKAEQVTFTSSLKYNATTKEIYREIDHSQPQYVGTPSPEIDAAWDTLLHGQYLLLSDEEAAELENPVPVEGLWISEVEVMHSLHCLNTLRKALAPDYYAEHNYFRLQLQPIHIEHCIEQLRQSIQCAGDLTPVPIRPLGEGRELKLVGTPMTHTCRDWSSFRNWYTLRGESHGRP